MNKQNRFKRLWQHWLHPWQRVERYFPTAGLKKVSEQIAQSENQHHGEIRFVVESRLATAAVLQGLDTRTRAWQWFGELSVWNTEYNTGVLVYISFADRAVEIVVDRGISAQVPDESWTVVCQHILTKFQQQQFVAGLELGLQEVNQILIQYFPNQHPDHEDINELPNDVVLR